MDSADRIGRYGACTPPVERSADEWRNWRQQSDAGAHVLQRHAHCASGHIGTRACRSLGAGVSLVAMLLSSLGLWAMIASLASHGLRQKNPTLSDGSARPDLLHCLDPLAHQLEAGAELRPVIGHFLGIAAAADARSEEHTSELQS